MIFHSPFLFHHHENFFNSVNVSSMQKVFLKFNQK
jgi:hypothetical protein